MSVEHEDIEAARDALNEAVYFHSDARALTPDRLVRTLYFVIARAAPRSVIVALCRAIIATDVPQVHPSGRPYDEETADHDARVKGSLPRGAR